MPEILVITDAELLVLPGDPALEVLDSTQGAELLEVAQQGPPGGQGATGAPGGTAVSAIAGQALGGHRAIVLDATGAAFYADCAVPGHFGRLAGVTQGAAITGDSVTVIGSGVMTEPSWAWTADAPVFLGSAGLLTQTVPVTGFLQIIGIALSATTLFINPREPLATL